MYYRAFSKFSLENYESESFKEVYESAIRMAKWELYADPSRLFMAYHLFSFEDAVDMVNDITGDVYTCYLRQKNIGYMTVSRENITIALFFRPNGICVIERSGNK